MLIIASFDYGMKSSCCWFADHINMKNTHKQLNTFHFREDRIIHKKTKPAFQEGGRRCALTRKAKCIYPSTFLVSHSVVTDLGRSKGIPKALSHICCANTPKERDTPNNTV